MYSSPCHAGPVLKQFAVSVSCCHEHFINPRQNIAFIKRGGMGHPNDESLAESVGAYQDELGDIVAFQLRCPW